MTIKQQQTKADEFYALMNKTISQGVIPIIDAIYPKHDGKQNPYVAADYMILRDTLNSISRMCQNYIDKISEALE